MPTKAELEKENKQLKSQVAGLQRQVESLKKSKKGETRLDKNVIRKHDGSLTISPLGQD